jgi:hypothetical protein
LISRRSTEISVEEDPHLPPTPESKGRFIAAAAASGRRFYLIQTQ